MRQITSIEPQSKPGSRRLNVFLDGKYGFSLTEELAARLTPGSFLSDLEIAELRHEDDLHQVYEAALLLLSYRPRSVAELRSRLLRKGFDEPLIDQVLERLQNHRVLNDQEFAQFWVENRQSYNPRGSRMLSAELRSKGLDREIIEGVLPSPEEEEQAALRIAERKARTLKGMEWREFRRRLGEHLVRRGFRYEVAGTVTRRLWNEMGGPPEDDQEEAPEDP